MRAAVGCSVVVALADSRGRRAGASRSSRWKTGVRAAVGCAVVLGLAGCAVESLGQDRECERLVEDLRECTGVSLLPSDCDAIGRDDVRALAAALEGGGCEFFMDAIPGDGDLRSSSCRLYGQGCVASVQPEPPYAPARYPILLVNGVDVSPLFRWSDRIVETLERSGHSVHLATLPPYSSVHTRALALQEIVERVRRETGAPKVSLICHSFGGLDCRYLVSPNGLAFELGEDPAALASAVASITTVGTAHRGTPIADAALGLLPRATARDASEALATWIGEWFGPERLATDAELRASLIALSEANAPSFNARIVDAPGIHYQSWAGVSRPYGEAPEDLDAIATACAPDGELPTLAPEVGPDALGVDYMATPLVAGADYVGEEDERPHDGLCPIDSARWGLFRGCVPADHMEQLGQQRLPDVNVRTGFDVARFYAAVAADLAGRGM